MSAIWGYLSYTTPINETLPSAMEAPYREKCSIDRYRNQHTSHLYMGCGIQHITKEAQQEALPIFDEENGIYFTADCILDNRDELSSLLHTDAGQPDGTLMFLAYKAWGIDCLTKFRGMFSIAVYDTRQETLYLASDQVSSRCLYYHKTESFVCFSTLLEPIRRVCPGIALNEYYLKDFLTTPGLIPNVVSTDTPYTGIFKINPGYYMTITRDRVTEHSYWTPLAHKKKRHFTAKSYGKAFRSLYTDCVKDTLRTDGEVGISMSSGLDSASVGALASLALKERNKTLFSYTYVPYETPEPDKRNKDYVHDETEDVMKIVAMYPNMKPHFLNNNGKSCFEFLPEGIDIMEIPYKAVVNFPNLYEVYSHAKNDRCKIVLTGQSGNTTISHGKIIDILYDSYQKRHYLRFFLALNRYSKTTKISRKKALCSCLQQFKQAKEVSRHPNVNEYRPDNPFLSEHILDNYPLEKRYKEGELESLVSVPTNREFYLQFLHKKALYTYIGELETKLGLATGILLRDPTRDIRLLEFCADLPYHLFAHRGTPRWLIRENLNDLLPASILENWMRYGVQNSDWLLRIERDFPDIRAFIQETIANVKKRDDRHLLSSVIDTENVLHYLSAVFTDDESAEPSYCFYLCFIVSMVTFLNTSM